MNNLGPIFKPCNLAKWISRPEGSNTFAASIVPCNFPLSHSCGLAFSRGRNCSYRVRTCCEFQFLSRVEMVNVGGLNGWFCRLLWKKMSLQTLTCFPFGVWRENYQPIEANRWNFPTLAKTEQSGAKHQLITVAEPSNPSLRLCQPFILRKTVRTI